MSQETTIITIIIKDQTENMQIMEKTIIKEISEKNNNSTWIM